MPWQVYSIIGFVVLFVGGIGLIFLYAFLEGWWLSRQSIPVRFDTLENESDFESSALPAIAEELGMTQVDRLPGCLSTELLNGMLGDWKGAEFRDILLRNERAGVFLLCNVRRAKTVIVGDSSGEGQAKRYLEVDPITITAFRQTAGPYLPEFSTRPFIDLLIVKLYKLLGRTWYGHPRFEGDPEFHEKVLISAAEPKKVRPVLTDHIRKVLKENCDLTMVIRDRTIVVYPDGHPVRQMMRKGPDDGERIENCKVLAAVEWPCFFRAAQGIIISMLQTSPKLAAKPDVRAQSTDSGTDEPTDEREPE